MGLFEPILMKKTNLFIFIGIVIGLAGAPVLVTHPAVIRYFGFTDVSELVSVVNNLTAPVIAIAGAVVVYISFKEQVKANTYQFKALNEQRELDMMYRFYEELRADLARIQTEYGEKHKQTDILDSFMNYVYQDRQNESPYPDLSHFLEFVLKQFTFLAKRIKRTHLSKSEKVYFIDKLNYLYKLYFEHYQERLESKLMETRF